MFLLSMNSFSWEWMRLYFWICRQSNLCYNWLFSKTYFQCLFYFIFIYFLDYMIDSLKLIWGPLWKTCPVGHLHSGLAGHIPVLQHSVEPVNLGRQYAFWDMVLLRLRNKKDWYCQLLRLWCAVMHITSCRKTYLEITYTCRITCAG